VGWGVARWVFRILLTGIVGLIGFWAYDADRAGYFSLPDIPEGAYTLCFKNGFRAIVLDADVPRGYLSDAPKYFRALGTANPERKYFGAPSDVQPWFKDAWSWCKPPTDQEKQELQRMPEDFKRSIENARFEAVCRIDVDGAEIVRGLIFSVPKL
jgi:hypothetical protein